MKRYPDSTPSTPPSFFQYVKDFSSFTWSAISCGFRPFMYGGWLITGQEHEMNRQKAKEASDLEGQILKTHTAYSECIGVIKAYELKIGKNYAEEFLRKIKGSPRDPEIKRMNDCRSLTKDWWEMVQDLHTRHGMEPELKRQKYNERFQFFKTLVSPIDRQEGSRSDLLNTVYDFDLLKPSEPTTNK